MKFGSKVHCRSYLQKDSDGRDRVLQWEEVEPGDQRAAELQGHKSHRLDGITRDIQGER